VTTPEQEMLEGMKIAAGSALVIALIAAGLIIAAGLGA